MANKKIKVEVLDRQTRPGNGTSYEEIELLAVADQNGKRFNLTRFRAGNENKIVPGYIYEGTLKPSTKEGYNDIFSDVEYLKDGWGGVGNPFWPQGNDKVMDARQKSILVQSDMRTAAMLIPFIFEYYFSQANEPPHDWKIFYGEIYQFVKSFREEQEAK